MHRTQTSTLLFAVAAALVTVVSAWLAYVGLRSAFEREFEARLVTVTHIVASQIGPEEVADVRRLGADGGGYYALQAQLDELGPVTGFANFALVDSAGVTVYDVEFGESGLLARSQYDSLAHHALAAALAGRPGTARIGRRAGEARVAFEPVRSGTRVVGVLAAEARPSWGPHLQRLRRRLLWTVLVSVAAIAVLTGILVRATSRRLALERRLSRSENLAAMGRLTATLAHEIKNPLAIIRGSAKRLGKLEPEAQRMADSVIEEVDRLGRTVARYLQFARGESRPDEPGEAIAALSATLDLLEGEFRSRGCTLARDLAPGPVRVRLDAESLKQVALNLVLNALEALGAGGTVTVALTVPGPHAELHVADDGPGMPPDVLARAGEPFFTTRAQGTGLGLFLARRLVEGAGGTLRIASHPGEGTRVEIHLPLAGVETRGQVDDK